jgi:protein TonB
MELKKNPSVDPKRNSKLYFQVGLVAVMLLTYIGIELKSADPIIVTESLSLTDNFVEDEETILTLPPVQKLPPPPPPSPEVIQIVEDKIILKEEKIQTTEVDENKAVVVVQASAIGGDSDDIDVPDELPFAVIEDIPLFPGCETVPKSKRLDCFNEKMAAHIKKNFSYPQRAAEDGIQGRVSIQFMIDKQGNVTNIQMRGPKGGELLEKEAERIISKLPKFTPGKQRGKPVKVKYGLPINFKLQ